MNVPLHHQRESMEVDSVIVEAEQAELLSIKTAQYLQLIFTKLCQNGRKLYKP
ncbi:MULTISPECIES: hypothetical protein [unclassified Bartonella]|uniref:hypothetical protein n=1 Tax=unclassified Bartonella TaxID=2645622 RepID=UPI0023615552|nr:MULTISPECIES: hypothetical protein [unclassified Bartonella]